MKNVKIFILGMVFFPCFTLQSQGVYFDVNVGYGFPTFKSYGVPYYSMYTLLGNHSSLYYYDGVSGTSIRTTSEESTTYTYGKGLNLGGSVGYMFSKYIATEIGVIYVLGSSKELTDYYSSGYGAAQTVYKMKGKMLQLVPAIIISPGFNNFNPYAKFGVIVGFGSYSYNYISTYSSPNEPIEIKDRTIDFSGGVSFGINGCLGVQYNINKALGIFIETNLIQVSYSPKKGEVTKSTFNGVNDLHSYTTSERRIEFVDEYSETVYNYNYEDQPSKELRYSVPFSTIGLNFGVRIVFSNK